MLHHSWKWQELTRLIFLPTKVNSSVAITEIESFVSTMLSIWWWVKSLFPKAITLVSSSWVAVVEALSIAWKSSTSPKCSCVNNRNVVLVHGLETIRFLTEVHLTETRTLLSLISTFHSFKSISNHVLAMSRLVSGRYCRIATRDNGCRGWWGTRFGRGVRESHFSRCTRFYHFVVDNLSLCDYWTIVFKWTHSELLKGVCFIIKWTFQLS